MLRKEIPFRPKLEGIFRTRFYNAVCDITEETSITETEKKAEREIFWIENECAFNLQQRKKYRAIWYLLRDLLRASWKAAFRDGVLYMSLPSLDGKDAKDSTSPEVKALLRQWMAESRRESLLKNADFVFGIEEEKKTKRSIKALIANGHELAERLKRAKNGDIAISDAVKPYLQLVQENERDEFTGLKLSEIWRYFRLTWSTPYEPTPGRTLLYLIRDAAHPNHAVMGIASLENCAVQITCRDEYLGWNPQAFIQKIKSQEDPLLQKELFNRLLQYIEDGIAGIDYSQLCEKSLVEKPTEEIIKKLSNIAVFAEQQRQESLRFSTENPIEEEEKSDLGHISKDVEKSLYTRKRADQLSKYLNAKLRIITLLEAPNFQERLQQFLLSEDGASAIRTALVAQKTKHIGSSMMELNVCGAIPPYNEILGGKLVALLAGSPQVLRDYKERYKNRPSEIASRLKGSPVCRPADLVYIGTTSLYYVGSSQYNRLKIPSTYFGGDVDYLWQQIGMTMGYGTMHISKNATAALTEASSDGFTKINHVFGEGASPKMRLLTMAIRQLLESTSDDLKDFSKHAMSRIVYGLNLAKNTTEYLLGLDKKPQYYTDIKNWKAETQKIIDFWSERWLKSRLNFDPVFERLESFNLEQFLLSNQINTAEPKFEKLKEEISMPVTNYSELGLDFVRNFYRGSSAYADHQDIEILKEIHLETKLDSAIFEQYQTKDIVLTGNPGDGKTHIIRVLKERLESDSVVIETDASTLTHDEIYEKWKKAREEGKRFIIAINAAVLYSTYQNHKDFEPLREAYEQLSNTPYFHQMPDNPNPTVALFDLSKREVLTPEILSQMIKKFSDGKYYKQCQTCPVKGQCTAHVNIKLLSEALVQQRIMLILNRVKLSGYHATLRELQNFISYLIFGDKSCSVLAKNTSANTLDLCSLIYSGKGNLFDQIRKSFDPVRISHPTWDEKILNNEFPEESWIGSFTPSKESIAFDNEELFRLRKRQFYFYNNQGSDLMEILDDDESKFQQLLELEDKKVVKELIKKINAFFGSDKPSNGELQIWNGHRFNNDPRKILISTGTVKASSLQIGRPLLPPQMSSGMETFTNYIRLEKKDAPNIFLKIDFPMFCLLTQSEHGVPVLFMESNLVKKIWRFIEQLQPRSYEEDEIDISILDIQNKNHVIVKIDLDDHKYVEIRNAKLREE